MNTRILGNAEYAEFKHSFPDIEIEFNSSCFDIEGNRIDRFESNDFVLVSDIPMTDVSIDVEVLYNESLDNTGVFINSIGDANFKGEPITFSQTQHADLRKYFKQILY